MLTTEELQKRLFLAKEFDQEVLQTIHDKKWLQIWVPKEYGGLDCSLPEGLKTLQDLARIDGSFGWFITLCSGANYFARNLKKETASKLFNKPDICFGGSGMLSGTAEKVGGKYVINGFWSYATGAPYLSHFTLNAHIVEDGKPLLTDDGQPKFLSFVLEPSQVEIIPEWNTMGMVATASHSFKVDNQYVPEEQSFVYNEFYSDGYLSQVPFQTFADLTLLVNYIGMAEHFLIESEKIKTVNGQAELRNYLNTVTEKVNQYAEGIEKTLLETSALEEELITEIHQFGEDVVEKLMIFIIKLHQSTGIKSSANDEVINQIFKDFFTATQHANFRPKV
ncbi:hypothetical protein GCM10007424_16070 [Flavobacterium suaedae]|uniref:Acyl-CoA dehydrogenase/oxidase N-terminal domain-containing protein n=1 Tax=Flavobacterium suaedae TaxID=1767027 RepID=A0ABQ1JWN0_9FLAO|nr:acyl-CoA dehydrogenase family protein [Flavobacterium suaedae]GGB76825.1 hypothetical protein GCM10007424_16070 [Flavobacterium suaedae]